MSDETPTATPDDAAATTSDSATPVETSKSAKTTKTKAVVPATDAAGNPQVVYVHAPVPPKVHHNRLFGALLALLGTVIFGLAYFAAVSFFVAVTPNAVFETTTWAFINSSAFWVPVLFFAISAVIVAVLLNRAPWWGHVIGSIVVALVVFWASAGVLTLLGNVFVLTPDEAAKFFWAVAANPIIFIATIIAREVSLWMGLAISKRGGRVRMRNAEAKTVYDSEQAEKKAEYERAATTV